MQRLRYYEKYSCTRNTTATIKATKHISVTRTSTDKHKLTKIPAAATVAATPAT